LTRRAIGSVSGQFRDRLLSAIIRDKQLAGGGGHKHGDGGVAERMREPQTELAQPIDGVSRVVSRKLASCSTRAISNALNRPPWGLAPPLWVERRHATPVARKTIIPTPSPTTTSGGFSATGAMTGKATGPIRTTSSGLRLATQRLPAPAAMPIGAVPSSVELSTTVLLPGSIRETVGWATSRSTVVMRRYSIRDADARVLHA
jgi:hypothetical protein